MTDFAIIIHPVNLELLHIFDSGTSRLNPTLVTKILEWTPSFYASTIQGTRSITGKRVGGHLVMCPLLPEQMLNLNHGQALVIKRVLEAARIAEQLGVKILGLAAYVSAVGRKGMLIARQLKTPVTTGTSYTIGVVSEAVLNACEEVGIRLESSKVAVVGATGTVGSACSAILGAKAPLLILVGRNVEKLQGLVERLREQGVRSRIEISDSIQDASRDADAVVVCTNSPAAILNVSYLKPGSVVCDVSQPHNIAPEAVRMRPDVLFIDGGVVKPPGEVNFNFNFGLPPGLAFACIAETMILALEERYENYSLGGAISLEKVKNIVAMGQKHGFRLAGLRSFNELIGRERIEKVREARLAHAQSSI